MNLRNLVFVFVLSAVAAQGQPPFTCNVGAANVPDLRAEGLAEFPGEVVLNCSGGAPTPAGQPVPIANLTVKYNAPVNVLPIGGGYVGALLSVDEPAAAQVRTCNPFQDPWLYDCRMTGTGRAGIYNPAENASTTNTFVARLQGANTLSWQFPLDQGNHTLRVYNARLNANQLASGGTLLIQNTNPNVTANVTVRYISSPTVPVPITGTLPINVGTVSNSMTFSVLNPITLRQCDGANPVFASETQPTVEVTRFAEGTSFQARFVERTASAWKVYKGQSPNEPSEFAPSIFSGDRMNAAFSQISVQNLNGGATEVSVRFSGIPTGTRVYAETKPDFASLAGGTAFSSPHAAGVAALLLAENGRAEAVYSLDTTNPNVAENFGPRFWLAFPPGTPGGHIFALGRYHSGVVPGTLLPQGLASRFWAPGSKYPAFNIFSNTATDDLLPNVAASIATCGTSSQFSVVLPPTYPVPFTETFEEGVLQDFHSENRLSFVSHQAAVTGITTTPNGPTTRQATSNWLTVDTDRTSTPMTARITINPKGLTPGTYAGSLRIAVTGLGAFNFPVNLVVSTPRPVFSPWGVASVGSYVNNVVSPGGAVIIFGQRFGPTELARAGLTADNKLSTVAGETRVLFDGVAAPMIYAVNGQLTCIAPFALAGKTSTSIEVEYRGVKSGAIRVPVAPAVPSLLAADSSGFGKAAALNQDNTFNSVIGGRAGEYVVFFGVGGPATNPAGRDGEIYTAPLPVFTGPVSVFIGNRQIPASDIAYLGPAPGLVHGVWQANVRLPADAPAGRDLPIQFRFGDYQTQPGVTVSVR